MRLSLMVLLGLLVMGVGYASADRGIRAQDLEFQREVEAFKAGPKVHGSYLRLVDAMERSGALDLDDGPELFEKALHETIGVLPEQCRGLGVALAEGNFLAAATYLAEIHCKSADQKELKNHRESIKAQVVKELPNIDG